MRNFAIATLLGVAAASFAAQAQDAAAPPPGYVPVSVVRDKVLAPVFVNGAGPYPFILDFGVEYPVLSRDVAATVRPDATTEVRVKELRLGEAASKPMRALVMDLASFSATLGTTVSGIFNGREMGDVVDLDLSANLIAIRAHSDAGLNAADSRSTNLRLDEHGQPLVSALLNEKHVRSFILDTTLGAIVAMPERVLRDLGFLSGRGANMFEADTLRIEPAAEAGAGHAPSVSEMVQVRLKNVRLGGTEVKEPVCSVQTPEDSPRIGLGFLRNSKATFDFTAKLLQISPKEGAVSTCDPVVGCGLIPADLREDYWTVLVVKNSPAAKAGIQSGVRLVEVNGADLKIAPYNVVMEKLSAKAGDTLTVTVLQEGGLRTIALTAKTLL